MEYFQLQKDFWIARWQKKPNKNIIAEAEKNILENNRIIIIGISESISNKIITEFKKRLNDCEVYGATSTDFDGICTDLELPKAIIMLILERKGFLRKYNRRQNE